MIKILLVVQVFAIEPYYLASTSQSMLDQLAYLRNGYYYYFLKVLLTGITNAANVLPLTTLLSYIMFYGATLL
jgi:hypothetical protein